MSKQKSFGNDVGSLLKCADTLAKNKEVDRNKIFIGLRVNFGTKFFVQIHMGGFYSQFFSWILFVDNMHCCLDCIVSSHCTFSL